MDRNNRVEQENQQDQFTVSQELIQSPTPKAAGITQVTFDGLLETPLQLQEDVSEGCGGQMWPAGTVLARYLLKRLPPAELANKTILELGAGGGLVGLALAMSMLQRNVAMEGSHIYLTDQTPMLSLMQRNIALNQLPTSLIHASVLDWGSSDDMKSPDILLAADCVYFEPAFPLLLQTMGRLMQRRTTCFFCFKKRRRADMKFVKDMKKIFDVTEVEDDPEKPRWSREGLFLYKALVRS